MTEFNKNVVFPLFNPYYDLSIEDKQGTENNSTLVPYKRKTITYVEPKIDINQLIGIQENKENGGDL